MANAIESVLRQTYTDFEIIVCDDRSTDNTKAVVEQFKDGRVKYLLNPGCKGPSAARNSAIKVAGGEYIAFLDDDDEWLEDKLSCQIAVMEKSSSRVGGIHSNLMRIDRVTGTEVFEKHDTLKLKGNLYYTLGVSNPIKTSTLIIRRKCLDEIGLFDETMSYMEDRDLLIRLSRKWDFEYVSKPLVRYYYHARGQLTGNIKAQIDGKEKVFSRYPEIFQNNRKKWSAYLLGLGIQY
ncbi:MAG: glycosyltransferase family 2 protein, partial [Desulfobacteraceae bacterium]|nr:glycosyltransferase family 2 protein [Desulfobacteraceae bacterium]